MGYIYKITNNINQHSYIGQTTRNLAIRWKEHIKNLGEYYDSQKNSQLHQALLKYGVENFSFEELEQCNNDLLNERECYWIEYYNSYKNGYNMTPGGNNKGTKYNTNEVFNLWQQGKTVQFIMSTIGCMRSFTVTEILKAYGINQKEINHRSNLYKAREVEQYSLTGDFIKKYDSLSTAAKETQQSTGQISYACSGKITSSGGYIWKYVDDITDISILVNNCNNKIHHGKHKVAQYTLNGDYIQTFNTVKEAANFIGAKSQTSITNVCKGRAKSGYGYIWKYIDNMEE